MRTEIIILEKQNPNCPWEGCINSVVYRVERGVPVEVPETVAEIVRQSERTRLSGAKQVSAFTRGGGVRLA